MSNEQKEKKVKVFNGRPRTEKREGAKKLDLSESAKLFQEEFYQYWPDPSYDYSDYENEDRVIDIDSIPTENLIEFKCRYIDPGTLQELAKTPFAWDLPDSKNLKEQDVEKVIRDALENQKYNMKSEEEFRAEVLLTCVIEPEFESTEQIRKILPVYLINELYLGITRGAIGENIVSRF